MCRFRSDSVRGGQALGARSVKWLKNRHCVAPPCRTPWTVCGGCPEARVFWAFQTWQRWNPRGLGVCGQALRRCPFHAGFGACSAAAGLCLHCALSASAARGVLNVCSVRTSAVPVLPQKLPGSPRPLGVSERAALEPSWIGRLRAGSAETLIPRGFQA